MEVVGTRPVAWQPAGSSTSSKPGESSTGAPVSHQAAPDVRLCLRNTCGHTRLPPASQWAYQLCPPCLEATRLKEASAKAAESRRNSASGVVPSQSGTPVRPMGPPPAPNVSYFEYPVVDTRLTDCPDHRCPMPFLPYSRRSAARTAARRTSLVQAVLRAGNT